MNPEPRLSVRMKAQILVLWLAYAAGAAALYLVDVLFRSAYGIAVRIVVRAAVVTLSVGVP